MDYSIIIDLDRITLQECDELHRYKDVYTIISDGRIVNFVKDNCLN